MLGDALIWFEANETVLSGVAAAVVVLSIVGAAMRGGLMRGATSFVGALRSRREARSNLSETDVSQPVPGFGGRAAIAVLPFDNMSGDPEQEYFVDGITEDIITSLQSFRTFPVIARNSTFTYKGAATDVRKVARELGVGYVVEGSVRKVGDRVRITGQLLDATGRHVWADRYDRDLSDIFAVQDEITAQIVAAVAPEIDKAELLTVSRKRSTDMVAWDYLLQAQHKSQALSLESLRAAVGLLEKALTLDPQFGQANAMLAMLHGWFAFFTGEADDETAGDSLEKAIQYAKKALLIDNTLPYAHAMLGATHWYSAGPDMGLEGTGEAIRLNPSDPVLRVIHSISLRGASRFAESLEQTEVANRLCPGSGVDWILFACKSLTLLHLRRNEDALEFARRALEIGPGNLLAHIALIVALDTLGQTGAARETYEVACRRDFEFSPVGLIVFYSNLPDIQAQITDAFRRAGWDG